MNRVHQKPRSRCVGTLVGWALCIAGALVGVMLLICGVYSRIEGLQSQVTTLLGVGILIFFVAGLPKGARSDNSAEKPHTTS
jgi:archaellum biogenesis protein FlaJ (TadC family)